MEQNGQTNPRSLPERARVALVYDRVNKWGGAERVIVALRKIFPDSVLFASVYKEDKASWAKRIPIKTSFLQKLPLASSHHEALAVFMPIAFESFNFDEFDLVISVTSESAKGIITKPHTRHISIILTPTRYIWSGLDDYFSNSVFRFIAWPIISYLRFWDRIAAKRPDSLIAISETVCSRIKKYYDLESKIIYPPLMMKPTNNKSQIVPKGSLKKQNKYFLVVSRLVPYKRIDLAIRSANKARVSLKVVGVGNELEKLKKIAGPTVEFLGQVSDSDLKYYYANCKALIFPGVEDFGLTMVEAQSFGKPIIAFRGGGAEEIIIEGRTPLRRGFAGQAGIKRPTGVFFEKQTVASLAEKLKNFKVSRYNSLDCKKNARRFSFDQFKKSILQFTQ